jgi:hypothetical protein
MDHTACLVCLICTVTGHKKAKNDLKDMAQEAGTEQNLSNLYFLDIYGQNKAGSLSQAGRPTRQ